jgi:succinyl-diaminopimelate desuccinylase
MQLEKYRDSFIQDAMTLVSIPSVSHSEPGYPTGKNAVKCLETMLGILKGMGFSTYADPDGYYGYAEIGQGPLFGILGHLDVVPARLEDGWESDPFKPEIRNGRIYARGIQDDKGPTLAAAYALKALLDSGAKLKNRVRIILGLAEETSWACIRHYVEKEEIPVMSFTPDGSFPLVYAEKGLLQVEFSTKVPAKTPFRGGDSMNAVAAFALTAQNDAVEAKLKEHGFAYKIVNGEIETEGKSAHAKNPWLGVNAIYHLATALQEAGLGDRALDFITDCLAEKHRFEGFTNEKIEDFSGPLSVNVGMVTADETGTRIGVDLRLPVTYKKEDAMRLLREKGDEYGLTMTEEDWLRSIYLPLDSPLATTLMAAYQKVTGDTETKPKLSGGATYARALDNCVAFGANFPNVETTEHMPNEYAPIDSLMKAMEIYCTALQALVVE